MDTTLDDSHHTLLAESNALLSASDLQLDQLSKAELQTLCREHQLWGWSRLHQSELLAFVRKHLEPSPAAEPVIHFSDASRMERLLLLLLDHLGVAPEDWRPGS